MVNRFLDFINEATLSDDKRSITYELNGKGREKLSEYLASFNKNTIDVIFKPVDTIPDDEKVLIIKPSSFSGGYTFDELKKILDKENSDFLLYSIETDDLMAGYNYAVSKLDTKTSLLRQYYKLGTSKRGDHFRETAFMITMAIKLWEKEKKKIEVHTIRGEILMEYSKNLCEISEDNNPKLIEEYYSFITNNKTIVRSMELQSEKLIDWIKKNGGLDKLSSVVKNNIELPISKKAQQLLYQYNYEKELFGVSRGDDMDVPEIKNLSKWNPSDIWLIFGEFESEIKKIYDIFELNNYLGDCIKEFKGIVGISLKQNPKTVMEYPYKINMNGSKIIKKYKDFDIDNKKKTAMVKFDYEINNKTGDSNFVSRTFDGGEKTKIQIEISGGKGTGYVSGKAGYMVDFLLKKYDIEKYKLLNDIRLETDKEKIREIVKKYNYSPNNPKIKEVFEKDLEGEDNKNSFENSRLQSAIFIDWLISQENRDDIISNIVNYARSESELSSPHLLIK